MYIRRDYTQPFFSNRRRKRRLWLWLLLYTLLIGGFLFFVDSQFSRLQMMALSAIGQAPEPTPFASVYANQSMERFAAGNLNAAADLMLQAVNQQPQNVDYLYEYGRILLELGQDNTDFWEEAITIGDRAMAANPNDPRGYALKARAMDLSGDSANAIPVAQAGLNIDQHFAPLHSALSSAYLSIDRYDVSLEEAEKAVQDDPNDPSARRIYSYILLYTGQNDEAIDQLQQAITLNPNLSGAYFELARLYRYVADNSPDTVRATELYADTIALYEQVLAMQPENARAYLRLCEAYFGARENQRAEDYCQEAVDINPQYSQAYASLGQTQYSQRNYETAIENFEQCVQYGGEDPDIRCYYLRGLAHYYLGQCDEAWPILNESINRVRQTSDDPTNPVLVSSQDGLALIVANCASYRGRTLPTAIPPTAIPPTPIGG